MALTADQMSLLNTLTYMSKKDCNPILKDMSVGDYVQSILNNKAAQDAVADMFQSTAEIQAACNQILADSTLSNLRIGHASRTQGGADRLVLVTPDDAPVQEAYVVIEGTTGGVEWRDDFAGGMRTDQPDGVSTAAQCEMLQWFQENPEVQALLDRSDRIVVSGHSKGGNSAKYLTLMDDRIDECISFDGQGFSDEFVWKYQDLIRQRQDKISNYNHQADFVNLLLNDVGNTHYIQGRDNGANYLLNHSMFSLVEGIPLSQNETDQWPPMKEADRILNSFLRTLSEKDKATFLGLLGEAAGDILGGDGELGLGDALDYFRRLFLDNGMAILKRFFQFFFLYASLELANLVASWFLKCYPGLKTWLDAIRQANNPVADYFGGEDIRFESAPNPGASVAAGGRILMDTAIMSNLNTQIAGMNAELRSLAAEIQSCASLCDEFEIEARMSVSLFLRTTKKGIGSFGATPSEALRQLRQGVASLNTFAEQMSGSLKIVAARFEENERAIIARIPDGATAFSGLSGGSFPKG